MTTPPRGTRVGLYLRISSDRDGDALGVERQRTDCTARAKREGWTIVREYVDNDTGASSKSTKKRPQYDQMIEDARAGKLDTIVSYSTSRLTRRPKEYESLIELTERHGVQIRTVASGDDDLSTADGRMTARIKSSVDAAESERIGERVSRKALANAQAGKFGGGRRPFGFEPDGVTIRRSEADEIVKATQTILRGGSLRSIVKDLNTRQISTTTGGTWTAVSLKSMIQRPRNSGMLKYNKIEQDEDGNRIINRGSEAFGPGSWEAIVSDDERLAVVAILSDPKRRNSQGNQPTWLGSSIYICGECGDKMITTTSGGRATRYVCRNRTEAKGNHISRNAENTDDVVGAWMVDFIKRFTKANKDAGVKRPDNVTPEWSALTSELSAIQQRAKDIQQDYADGYSTRTEFRAMIDRNREREAEIREKMSTGPEVSIPMFDAIKQSSDVNAFWKALPIEAQRHMVTMIFAVTILPTAARARFDLHSIKVEPKFSPYTVLK